MENATAKVRARMRVHLLARTGRLTELRESVGLSQSDVARALAVSQASVSRWEARLARPTPAHALALLSLLDPETP